MKKIHMMIAALLAFLPTMLWAKGESSTTYYAALKAQVSSSGGGMVYASDSNSTPSDGSFTTTPSTKQSSGSSSSFTFYAHAKANEGYRFTGWTGDATSQDNPCSVSVTSTSTSSSTYTTKTVTANFEHLPPATVTFAAPENGSYSVNGETISSQVEKADQAVPYSVALVATPAANFRFVGWYVLENGNKSFFSTDASTTKKFNEDATVGAEFIPDGYAIYAAVAAKGYDDLATALSEALPGESISVYSSTTLGATAAVDAGVSLTVASGVTLTVASGATLYVDGNATVNGTISGTVSKCTKLIQQTGQSDGVPFNPYGTVKYWKTSITTPSISISSSATHTTIVNGLGQVFRPTLSSSAKLIKCTIDASVAVNHIKSIAGESTSVNVVNDTLNSGMVILLGNDCVINGGLTAKTGFRGVVDCAGFTCKTITSQEVSGNNGKATFLNCPSFTGSKVINITHDYFNCDKVTLSSFNAGGSPILNFYDCGTFASPASFSASYSKGPSDTSKFNFYSGCYNSLTYKTCFKVYGGSYKSDPSTYIADQDGFEAVYDSSSRYYSIQEKVNIVNVVSINGTEYATLSDAISAASNGATISLIEAVDLEGGSVTIPAGKNVTIAVDKHTISGGKIVNNGTLLITDATVENEGKIACDIENNGTLDLVFGTYSGAIVNKAGTSTTHNGVFTGTLTTQGGMVALKGGHFTADVSNLVTADGFHVVNDSDGRYCVCEFPDGTMRPATVSSAAGYGATPYSDADFTLLYTRVKNGKTERKDYSSADWMRLAELLCFYQVFYNNGLDATLAFDRDVAKGSINLYAKSTISTSVDFKFDLPAGELYRALSETVVGTYGFYAKTYYSLIDENIKSVAMAVTDKSGNNNGTVCTAMVELWESVRAPDYSSTGHKLTNTVLVVGQKRFTIGAGSDKAMIRPETGAATFYATVTGALADAEDGATVMLTQDCEEDVVLAKAGSFTIDQNGFALTGTVTASGDYFIEKDEDGTYTVAKKGIVDENGNAQASIQDVVNAAVESEAAEVTITIPETTTEQTVKLPQDTTLTVVQAEGSETVVNVTPAVGYFVETTVVEPTEEQSGTTTVYESKKITEEVVTVTKETVQELNVKLEEFQVGSTETNEVSDVAQIVEAVNNLMENKALERADNVEQAKSETINLKAIVITPKAIVQEVQASATESEKVVKAAAFDVTPTDTGDNEIKNTSFTFRLPVADGMTGSMVVFHEKEFFGVYPILSWSDGAKLHKYIEITSSEFSEYSYEPRRGVEYAVAKIGDVGYDSLEDAVAAAAAGAKVELLKSTTLTNEIAVAKAVTLDLGDYTVTAASGKNAIQVAAGGSLTIEATTGGITAASGFAVYTDYELSQGVKSVTINGGSFSSVQFNKYPLQTSAAQSGESATPTTVAINGGTFNGAFKIYRCPTTIAGGTFAQGLDTSSGSVSVYSNSKTPVRVIGGKFKTEPVSVGNRVFVNAGYYYGGYFVVGDTSVCQAKRNGKFYRSVVEAFAAVGADTRIEILNGADVSGINVTLGEGQSLTVPSSFTAVAAANGYTLHTDVNTADGTVTYTAYVDGAVARIGGQHYASLDAAFEAAQDGDTITLVADATLGATAISAEVTLALAEHSVNVATTGINLTGKLTVTGVGLVSAVPALSGNGELVILGGTWTADPSAFVPQVVTALPGEQDDKAWTKDRCYVFANKAFVDGGWGDAEGLYTVVPLPKAYVTTMSEKPEVGGYGVLDCAYTFESFSSANGDDAIAAKFLEGGFSAFSNPVELARAKELLMEKMPFLDWNADFVVSLDGAADAGDLMLSGHYAQWDIGWVSYESPSTIDANQKIRLLVDIGQASPGDWPYENICRYVRTFDCGAKKLKSAMDGKTMTVQLRLYKPGEDEGLGSPSILICEYKYTFGGYAAKIVRSNETLRYATLAEAFAAVQANETIQLLNDYTGAADLTGCEVSFTLDKNGFGLAITGEPTTEEDWFFEKMSNDNWFHYYKKPATEEAPVVTVEVVDEDGETMSLSTLTPDAEWLDGKVQEGETAEEALAKVEENGLPAWQNYVIGQDPTAAVRVDTEQAPIDSTPVENTLSEKVSVPENSGFTVKYELDQVDADGALVQAVESKNTAESFTMDLTSVKSNAYYKLTAVIEAADGTGAKTKVASENTIGVLKVESSAKSTVIAVPWESLAANEQDITVADLVRTATLSEGDELKVYDTATGKYRAWTLNGSKEWKPIPVVGGASSEDAGGSTITRGSGVWLTRQDTKQPIYLVGEVAEQSTTTTIAGAQDDEPTWNLVAAPTVESVDLNAKFPDANEGDVVLVPTDGAPKRYTYKDGSWGYDDYEKTFNKKGIEVVKVVRKTDVTNVPIGTGFWYMNAGDAKNVEW